MLTTCADGTLRPPMCYLSPLVSWELLGEAECIGTLCCEQNP